MLSSNASTSLSDTSRRLGRSSISTRCFRLRNSSGTRPLSIFSCRRSSFKLSSLPSSGGINPVSLFSYTTGPNNRVTVSAIVNIFLEVMVAQMMVQACNSQQQRLSKGAPRRKRCAPAFNSQYIRPLGPGERHLVPCFSIITRRKNMFLYQV